MFKLSLWLSLAAIVCVAWGDLRGYQTHERGLNLAHGQMRARYEQCAAGVRDANPGETNPLHLLKLQCSQSLDDDRWLPLLAPHLMRDTAIAGAGPMLLALALVVLGVWAPRRFAAGRAPTPKQTVR